MKEFFFVSDTAKEKFPSTPLKKMGGGLRIFSSVVSLLSVSQSVRTGDGIIQKVLDILPTLSLSLFKGEEN